jgi:error-prone DNA polymerase
MGFKRSEARMKDIEIKLRAGMAKNGITGETADRIVLSITSFALYGFPESHAASFALLAYASAWLKCHYLAAFTCALLNNQPMGFYSPAVLVKDAQRHGLRVLPVDVNASEWNCTVEGEKHWLRLGLRYVRGLRAESGLAVAAGKPFHDVDDLARRVPQLRKNELEMLAGVGALAHLGTAHRRDALWQSGRAGRSVGPLLADIPESDAGAPLDPMTTAERLGADYGGTGLTIGRHPMHFRRAEMDALGVTRAGDLPALRNGRLVKVAGAVIVRQRPGTAKGIVFISLEDETGIFNTVVMPDVFDQYRLTIVTEPYLLIDGKIQNVDGVIHVLARRVQRVEPQAPVAESHDFR